ncbi:unnamed protein product, partial [Ectocarpus sp. 12 AP-2014]
RYFVPADGDDPSHPNVFQLPSGLVGSGSVRCGDVERHFPLPGRYHFRFKKKFRDAFVWVDMADPGAAVPSCDGVFTAKITRLSDGRGGGGVPPGRGEAMPPPPAGVRRDVGGGGGGGGSGGGGFGGDDLLNMGHGTAPGGAPGPGLMGGGSQPDDLLGMFDSSPSQGVPPQQTASVPSAAGAARPMPRSPPMHPAPMSQMGGPGVAVGGGGGGGGGGFGVGAAGMGGHAPSVRIGWGRYLKGVLPRGNVDIARTRPLMLSTRV